MANYVENIKVGGGESWPVRDAEAQATITALRTLIASLEAELEQQQTDLDGLETDVLSMVHTVRSCLPLTGGTLTGPLMFTEGVHYGTELPEAGTIGRIFFKKVSS